MRVRTPRWRSCCPRGTEAGNSRGYEVGDAVTSRNCWRLIIGLERHLDGRTASDGALAVEVKWARFDVRLGRNVEDLGMAEDQNSPCSVKEIKCNNMKNVI